MSEPLSCQEAARYLGEESYTYRRLAPKYEARAGENGSRFDYREVSRRLLRLAAIADTLQKQIRHQYPFRVIADKMADVSIRDRVLNLDLTIDDVIKGIPAELMNGVSKDDVRRHLVTLAIRTNVSYFLRR